MRKLLEQMKDLTISTILTGTLMGVVIAFLAVVGKQAAALVTEQNYGAFQDVHALAEAAAMPGPEILLKEEKQWKAGSEIVIKQAFTAKDYEGTELPLKVKQVLDVQEKDITSLYNAETGSITFSKPGSYSFILETIDSQKKKTVKRRPLIIDR